ncbi:F-box/kelch-repeat protein At3g23880 isoform X2 [Vigna angularis]|uniref:F-box/kelch-repeat protein At3g23880 isoform X2 n=1 Tax=Phaseolus angularis TaxID=3914 RepID=UPI000809C8F7|nr:F-box/kelch-repeat protein At3g23880 isoform X2 [Vigna angularis]
MECFATLEEGYLHSVGFTRKRERLINPMDRVSPQPSTSVQNQAVSESLPLPFLPNELVVEILSRLPVKSLLQFRCVCKSWMSLISDPYFMKKHLHLSTRSTHFNHHRIILSATTAEFHLKSCSVSSLFNSPSTVCDDLSYPVKNKFRHDGIVGSCNGLLCFAIKGDCVLLWNPSMRASKKSPPLGNNWRPGCFTAFGLGYDHVTEDYKVVAVFCDPNEIYSECKVKVYSMATNSWRKIQDFPHGFSPYQNSGKFVSGTLNWAANHPVGSTSLWVIVSLDLHKETYREVLPPDYEKEDCSTPTLGVLQECLCMNYDYKKTHFVVWMMKDYGIRESWFKLVSIPYLPNPEDFSYSGPYYVSENGEVLLMFEFDLILYDPRDNSFKYPRIESGKGWFDAEVYVETLVSPMKH